ncbi:hypothetical protein [Streptomyces sp. NPDC059918]|uniref:hypothetical protein n=1 Tax=unclassified Streptomyces TaxID=2593676 RepID=UPI00365F6EBC
MATQRCGIPAVGSRAGLDPLARRWIRGAAAPLSTHYGDLVRVALMEARPAGLQTRQRVAATRLTPSQVARGVRHLRDVGPAEHLTPIIWRRRDGYLFSDEPAERIEYEKKHFQLIPGRLTRMITGTLDPHLARYPDDEWAQLASAQPTGG